MAKIKTTTVDKVPRWATCYLVNNDDSALNEEDKKFVDDFEKKLEKNGLRLICPIDGSESEFEPYPAFGLACDTVDWTAEVLPKTFRAKVRKMAWCSIYVKAHSKAEAGRKALDLSMSRDRDWMYEKLRVAACEKIGGEG